MSVINCMLSIYKMDPFWIKSTFLVFFSSFSNLVKQEHSEFIVQ